MLAFSIRFRLRQWMTRLTYLLVLFNLSIVGMAQQGSIVPNSGFVVFGRVSLPDGKPAPRVKVYLETRGISRDTLSDDQGNYEIRGLTTGRYRMTAVNPVDSTMYTDPVELDSTRGYANRLQINIYFRYPLHSPKGEVNTGTLNAVEAAQNVPKPARQAYDDGLKSQKGNHPEKAMENFDRAIELYPQYFQALTERANLYMQLGRLAEALKDFERALQFNERYSPALRGAGYCNIQAGNAAEAIDQLQKSLLVEPKIALTHMLIGYANLSLNNYEKAKQSLQQALKLGGETVPRARVYLAEVLAHEEKFKEAADEIRAYLALKPDAPDAANLRQIEAEWRARAKR